MRFSNNNQLQAVRLEDGEAEYMGDGCWVLQRLEETLRHTIWHTFCLPEEDRQALLSLAATGGAPMIPMGDGEAHYMGDGCFALVRQETLGRHEVRHCIGVTMDDLERLAA